MVSLRIVPAFAFVLVGTAAAVSTASAGTVNFDDMTVLATDTLTYSQIIDSHVVESTENYVKRIDRLAYQHLGVVFDNDVYVARVSGREPGFAPSFLNDGTAVGDDVTKARGTAPNALLLSRFATPVLPLADAPVAITGYFVVPGTFLPAVSGSVTVDPFDGDIGSLAGRLDVYSTNAAVTEFQLIGADGVDAAARNRTLSVTAPLGNVHRFRFVSDDDSAYFDNFSFATPVAVPEPTSWGLAAAGLALAARRRRS